MPSEEQIMALGQFVLNGQKFNRRIQALNVGEHLFEHRDELLRLLLGQKLHDKRYKATEAWLFLKENKK